MKRILITVLAAALLMTALCGCGGSKVEYRSDVAVDALSQSVLAGLARGSDLALMKESYVKGVMGMDVSGYAEYAVYVSAVGTNIDEFGIFKLGSVSAADAEKQIKDYLQMREDTWMKEYTPEEHPKLQNAEIKVCGSYIIYVILDDAERAASLKAFEAGLTA